MLSHSIPKLYNVHTVEIEKTVFPGSRSSPHTENAGQTNWHMVSEKAKKKKKSQ